MEISSTAFGTYEGQQIDLYTLSNDNSMEVKIMNFGATITSITIPGASGSPEEIVCGFDKFEDYFSEEYVTNAPYFGGTVGRYCSQIKDAKFSMEGSEFHLAANCDDNNLHGGNTGFDKKVWSAKEIAGDQKMGLELSLESQDGEEGFPGKVAAKVTISLTNDNEIVIDYSAETDKTTPLSMTNHTYFNLSSFRDDVEGFEAKVFTTRLQEMDETGAGTGKILDVSDTDQDLSRGKIIGDVHAAIDGGFEHFWIFEDWGTVKPVAEISDPKSGRKLEVATSEPCMLLYTGKYTSDALQRNDHMKYGKYRGFCCETHRWQNGPNIKNSPGTFTQAGEKFKSTTIFKLSF